MNKNQKPQNPIYTLIVILIASVGMYLVLQYFCEAIGGTTAQKAVFTIISMPLPIFGIILYLLQRKIYRSLDGITPDSEDGSYFTSSEWRDKYLSYVTKKPFETIRSKSMKRDLMRRYRHPKFVLLMITCLLCAAVCAAALFAEYHDRGTIAPDHLIYNLIVISVGIVYFFICIAKLTARPVRKFLKNTDDISALEESYMSGKMVSHKGNGINLGSTHIIMYDEKEIIAIENSRVTSVTRSVAMQGDYEKCYFKYVHYAVVSYTESGRQLITTVELNEFQVEMVIEEFNRSQLNRSRYF